MYSLWIFCTALYDLHAYLHMICRSLCLQSRWYHQMLNKSKSLWKSQLKVRICVVLFLLCASVYTVYLSVYCVPQCVLYTSVCTVCTSVCTVYVLQCVLCVLYTSVCTVCIVCTMCIVCTVYLSVYCVYCVGFFFYRWLTFCRSLWRFNGKVLRQRCHLWNCQEITQLAKGNK